MAFTGPIARGGLVALALAGPALAAALPEDGAYDVEVRLELPHLEDMAAKSLARLCLAGAEDGAGGFAVLSANNPLTGCPVSHVHREGDALTFDIACAGRNAAHASARYVLSPQAFRGRIAMQMGGKNMTMTEVQSGRRVGPCEAGRDAAAAAPVR